LPADAIFSVFPNQGHEAQRFSSIGNKNIRSPVLGLLSFCCPTAVAFIIALAVVDPVKRVEERRADAHVFKKI
jgi:hypothetical protein